MEKKTIIKAAICDARNVSEEVLAAYGSLSIKTALLLSNSASQALLAQHSVDVKCARVLNLEGDVQISTVNGFAHIRSTDAPAGKRYLIVNGTLEIGPGTQQVLESYAGIIVNGSVTYPESLNGALGMLTVDGFTICYPDGAVLLKGETVVDRLFALRAKPALYWAARRLIMVDPRLDPAALEAKGARFASKEAILAESKAEGMINLLDERTEIILVPDGTSVIRDDVTLDAGTVKKYGRKLYILGDLTVDQGSAQALEELEYLHVRGDVLAEEGQRDRLVEIAQEIGGDVQVFRARGKTLRDLPYVRVSRRMLELEPEGVGILNCALVNLDADVDEELILERLSVCECALVQCTPEQAAPVAAVSRSVAEIGRAEDVKSSPDEGAAQVIKASQYVL